MTTIRTAIVAALLSSSGLAEAGAQVPYSARPTLAVVLQHQVAGGPPPARSGELRTVFENALVDAERFRVVLPEIVDDAVASLPGTAGAVDTDTAVRVARMAGARYAVILHQLRDFVRVRCSGFFRCTRLELQVHADIVDATTGETGHGKTYAMEGPVIRWLDVSDVPFDDSKFRRAFEQAAGELASAFAADAAAALSPR